MALIEKLNRIASAIRTKTGNTSKLTLDQMATEILNIQKGINPSGTISISSSGQYNVSNYAFANVNISLYPLLLTFSGNGSSSVSISVPSKLKMFSVVPVTQYSLSSTKIISNVIGIFNGTSSLKKVGYCSSSGFNTTDNCNFSISDGTLSISTSVGIFESGITYKMYLLAER